jgi:hypothetical protein
VSQAKHRQQVSAQHDQATAPSHVHQVIIFSQYEPNENPYHINLACVNAEMLLLHEHIVQTICCVNFVLWALAPIFSARTMLK